jgi:hypothetical protein
VTTRTITVTEDYVCSGVDGNTVILVVHGRVLDGNPGGTANVETIGVLTEGVAIRGIARLIVSIQFFKECL